MDVAAVAERRLCGPDAVMEADVLDSIEVLVRALGPDVACPNAMQSLVEVNARTIPQPPPPLSLAKYHPCLNNKS